MGTASRKPREKQVSRVLRAIEDGARTSVEVASITGIQRNTCAAWLTELRKCGIVKPVGHVRFVKTGIPAIEWELCQ